MPFVEAAPAAGAWSGFFAAESDAAGDGPVAEAPPAGAAGGAAAGAAEGVDGLDGACVDVDAEAAGAAGLAGVFGDASGAAGTFGGVAGAGVLDSVGPAAGEDADAGAGAGEGVEAEAGGLPVGATCTFSCGRGMSSGSLHLIFRGEHFLSVLLLLQGFPAASTQSSITSSISVLWAGLVARAIRMGASMHNRDVKIIVDTEGMSTTLSFCVAHSARPALSYSRCYLHLIKHRRCINSVPMT